MRHFVFFLARRHVRRRALQSGLTVLGVAVGVMVLITALSLTNGFIDELLTSTLRATPHVTLMPYSPGTAPSLDQDAGLLAALQSEPGVEAASPFVQTQALIARRADRSEGIPGTSGFVQIYGIDPELERRVLDLDILESTASELASGEGIVLGEALAFGQLLAYPGDTVRVVNILQQRQDFTVLGTFSVGNLLIDGVTAFASIPSLQEYLNAEDQISGYHLRTTDPAAARAVAQRLSREYGLFATTWEEIFGNLVNQLELQKALISAVVFLIVLVAAMGIANILILTVAEKTEEIAVLRAMGASQRQIMAVFTLEGLILGGGGTLLGALLGFGLSLYFKLKPFPLPGDLYYISQLPVAFQPFDFVWVCGLSLVTSVVAGLVPARRASNLDPATILR